MDDIIFTPEGKRIEKVVYAPVMTLQNIMLTPEDEQDLRNVQPFVLTTAELPEYDINYLGREKVDEIGCYMFSVKPKKWCRASATSKARSGWTIAICRSSRPTAKGVGLIRKKQRQPVPEFETYREQVDGKYWFPPTPTPTDTLHFKEAIAAHPHGR